ncbi:MAG: hypothetical protein AAFP90_24240 [Planctomycetota bacterium]
MPDRWTSIAMVVAVFVLIEVVLWNHHRHQQDTMRRLQTERATMLRERGRFMTQTKERFEQLGVPFEGLDWDAAMNVPQQKEQ